MVTFRKMEFELPSKGRHFNISTVLLVTFACLGSLSFSYSIAIISSTLGQPSFIGYMGLENKANAATIIGALPSVYYAGGLCGALIAELVADHWGRKAAIGTGAATLLISTAALAGSVNLGMYIAFRFFSGLGGLILAMMIPLWITESTPPNVRGAFAQVHGVFITIGYIVSSFVGFGFFFIKDSKQSDWRGPIAIGCVPCLLLLVGVWWLPESPRFLYLKDRPDEAAKIISRLHSASTRQNSDFIQREIHQMQTQIELDRLLDASWRELIRRPSFRKRALMAFFVIFCVLNSGSVIIATYGPELYAELGFSSQNQLLFNTGIFISSLVGAAPCVFYTDLVSRPVLIGGGIIALEAVVICYTALIKNYIDSNNTSGQAAAVAMTYVFFLIYGATVDGPFYYYIPELFPTHLRAKGMVIAMSTMCCFSVLWTQVTPLAITNIGWRYYLIFIIIGTLGGMVILLLFPNTQGKSLEEVAALFGDDDLIAASQQSLHAEFNASFAVEEISSDQKDKETSLHKEYCGQNKFQLEKENIRNRAENDD